MLWSSFCFYIIAEAESSWNFQHDSVLMGRSLCKVLMLFTVDRPLLFLEKRASDDDDGVRMRAGKKVNENHAVACTAQPTSLWFGGRWDYGTDGGEERDLDLSCSLNEDEHQTESRLIPIPSFPAARTGPYFYTDSPVTAPLLWFHHNFLRPSNSSLK